MVDVVKLFEQYLRKIGGECVEIRINYDKIPPFVKGSGRNSVFWKLVLEFLDKVQVLVKENTQEIHGSERGEDQENNGSVGKSVKKLSNNDKDCRERQSKSSEVDPSLVQITASKSEMDRRIAAFLRKKRLDVDIHNQREFCNLQKTENEFSCARVDAVFLPRVGQKSHITVTDAHRENEIMKSDDITVDTILHSVPSKRQKTENFDQLPYGVEERLDNIESHLKTNIKPVQHDVYSRLKQLEEKILYLEGLSPEYFSYKSSRGQINSRRFPGDRQPQRWTFEASYGHDLDERMVQLKKKLLSHKIPLRKKCS